MLAASGYDAARLEEFLEQQPELKARVVWAATAPTAVLGALDHDPDVFLLDMRWRGEALAAARTLQELGVPLVVCLFEQLDDPLVSQATALNLPVFHWGAPWRHLATRMRSSG